MNFTLTECKEKQEKLKNTKACKKQLWCWSINASLWWICDGDDMTHKIASYAHPLDGNKTYL